MNRTLLFTNALLIGFGLMGFEMLGSRYLNPYFGGGIDTWAAVISTVLAALMVGYFCGGALADRFPSAAVLGWLVVAAAVYMAFVPALADPMLEGVLQAVGDARLGVMTAAMILSFLPLALLGTFSPFGIRLILEDPRRSGTTAGLVYGISTFGNIAGTLVTTFLLIPSFGTRANTYVLAALIGFCGVTMILGRQKRTL